MAETNKTVRRGGSRIAESAKSVRSETAADLACNKIVGVEAGEGREINTSVDWKPAKGAINTSVDGEALFRVFTARQT
jgi:hypothetical protein